MQTGMKWGAAFVLAIGSAVVVGLFGTQSILIEEVEAIKRADGSLAVTMSIRNTGEPDRLLSAASTEAAIAEIVSDDADTLPIPTATVSLGTEAAFIMLRDIQGKADDGRLIPLTLTFEQAGEISAKARIGKPRMMHGGMNHGSIATEVGGEMSKGMAYDVPDDEPAPTLTLTKLPFKDGRWSISAKTENFRFSQEAADGPHEPGIGHAHLYVGGVKLQRLYAPDAALPFLPPGKHIVRVTLNTNDHRTYRVGGKPVTATVIIEVP